MLPPTYTRCDDKTMKIKYNRHFSSGRYRSRFCWGLATAVLASGAAVWSVLEVTAYAQGKSSNPAGTLPGIQVVSPLANGQWTTPEGDLAGTRFSPLSQINTQNASKLR